MRSTTKKITVAAVCTALAVIMCACAVYLNLSFMPLYLAAFCIFTACKRGGVPHGILCAVATAGIMFAMSGLTVKWITFVMVFAPYGVITSFAHKFNYFDWKHAIVRVLCATVYFNVTVGCVYLIATRALTAGIDLNISGYAAKLGGYAVFAVVATVVLVPLDFIFSSLGTVVLKRLPADREKKPGADPPITTAPPSEKQYDIFGYEITPEKKADEQKADTQEKEKDEEKKE